MLENLMLTLRGIPSCYDDFLVGIESQLKDEPDLIQPIMEYVANNPGCTPSDIIGRLWDLEGNDRTPLPIVSSVTSVEAAVM